MKEEGKLLSPNGKFVISLDFEIMWGVRDVVTLETYGEHLRGVQTVIPKLLAAFSKHKVKATFGIVGLLFFSTKKEMLDAIPRQKPVYKNPVLSPYTEDIYKVGESSETDPYHFAPELIDLIKSDPSQEIGTHTFSHFYCLDAGQTAEDFKADMEAAIAIAAKKNIQLKSLVFPRNQFNPDYLNVCAEAGITSVRGNEDAWFYNPTPSGKAGGYRRAARLSDAYLNISGHHCYSDEYMARWYPYNIASSRFLRPYIKKLNWLEWLRLRRIKISMTHAAKKNLTYHLWWHPHNFGINQDQNFAFLEEILLHYQDLNSRYNFTNCTMAEVADHLHAKYGR